MAYTPLHTRFQESVAPSRSIRYLPLQREVGDAVNILSDKKVNWRKRQVQFNRKQRDILNQIQFGQAMGYVSREDADAAYKSLNNLNDTLSNYSYLKNRVANKESVHRGMRANSARTERIRRYSIDDYTLAADDVIDAEVINSEPRVVDFTEPTAPSGGILAGLRGAFGGRLYRGNSPNTSGLRTAAKVRAAALVTLGAAVVAGIGGFFGGYFTGGNNKEAKLNAEMEALKAQQLKTVQSLQADNSGLVDKNRRLENDYATAEAISEELARALKKRVEEADASWEAEQARLKEKDLVRKLASDPILGNIPITLEKVTYNVETGGVTTTQYEYTGPTTIRTIDDLTLVLNYASNFYEPTDHAGIDGLFLRFLERNGMSLDAASLFWDPINGTYRADMSIDFLQRLQRDGAIVTERETDQGIVKEIITTPQEVDSLLELVRAGK